MEQLVDFSYLYEVSDMDTQYIWEVINIFMGVMPEGLVKLEDLINNSEDWDGIHRQAHFLKSSVSIVKVAGMYDRLYALEEKGREVMDAAEAGGVIDITAVKSEMRPVMNELTEIFAKAKAIIIAEQEKYKTI